MKRIGYIDARRMRYVVDGATKFGIYSWGAVIASGSLYLASDYGAYLNSWAAGKLEVCAATEVRIRVSGKGFTVVAGGHINTPYDIYSTGRIYFATNGILTLPFRTAVPLEEGSIWYDAATDKLRFRTAAGVEIVTSS